MPCSSVTESSISTVSEAPREVRPVAVPESVKRAGVWARTSAIGIVHNESTVMMAERPTPVLMRCPDGLETVDLRVNCGRSLYITGRR